MNRSPKYLPWTKHRLPGQGALPSPTQSLFRAGAKAVPTEPCTSNPTRMNKPFWKYMIAKGDEAYHAYSMLDLDHPSCAGPTWCFDRFGRTATWLPDGRIVFIGGEHEDGYDPDFCIYNDVVVVTPAAEPEVITREIHVPKVEDDREDGDWEEYWSDFEGGEVNEAWIAIVGLEIAPPRPEEITIYGYPKTVFPPTDGHVAVYVEVKRWWRRKREYIYIIGGIGDTPGVHREGTNVFRLNLKDFSIKSVATTGERPPHKVKAVKGRSVHLDGDDIVTTEFDGERYQLSLNTLIWRKLSKVAAPKRAEYVEEQYCERALPVSEDVKNGYL
ncbi:hypothetical protein B0T14DRAFT_517016 [Immersiella caudata]|uniref:Uncharacterized protein n=1 Tax=Immersiella caudata TaxID=314043 RepID=A0AA39WY48_9PEZI|nr:hypothetical protein B0T14DRAFT_517016 [Immersiella caudata]